MYSDETLTAYLDGETTPDITRDIDIDIASDPKLAARLDVLSLDKFALGTAFDPVLGLAQTRNLQHRFECANAHAAVNQNARPSGLIRLGSYAAALLVGVGIGWGFLGTSPDAAKDWRMEVAHYQALYVADTLSPITPDDARLAVEFSRANTVLGLSLNPADFKDIIGLKLRRAQVLGFHGAPLVQIAFTLPNGTPFAFCIVKKSGGNSTITPDTLVGLASAHWANESHGFLAIGGRDLDMTVDLAEKIAERL